jgi:hypothetical protein
MAPFRSPYVAAKAAFLVLMLLPMLVAAGLALIGVASLTGLLDWLTGALHGQEGAAIALVFVAWATLVVGAILGVIARMLRRANRV